MGWDSYELVFHTNDQSRAARLVAYARDPSLHFFPPGFAEKAVELKPHTSRAGPQLALVKPVRWEPERLLEWFRGHALLRRHASRIFLLDPEVAWCKTREELVEAVGQHGMPPGATALRIHCNPRTMQIPLADELEPHGFVFHPVNYSHALQVIHCEDAYRWSIIPAHWLYLMTKAEENKFKDGPGSAVNKLDEALTVLGLLDDSGKVARRLRTAIDLGASPGAWTTYLAGMSDLVIAVDQAELAPSVLELPNVRHIRQRAENAGPELTELVAGTQVDALVSDMNIRPDFATDIMASLLPYLSPGGLVILTFKYSYYCKDHRPMLNLMKTRFEGILEDHRCVWLLANTVNEATYMARKCSDSNGTASSVDKASGTSEAAIAPGS